ncbi:MAG: PDZ domain-containing protein, partial [Acidobacteriota bacterium]
VFENEGRLKAYDAKTDRVRTLAIQIPQDKGRLQAAVKNVKGLMRGAPSPSPDGKTLLVCARGDLFRLEPEKNAVLNLTRTSGVNEKNPAWSPDGRFYAYISDISGEEQIYLQQADGNGPTRQISDCVNSRLNMLSWSPDGAKIGYTDQRATYYVTDVQTGKTLDVFSDPVASVTQMVSAAWSPDGRWLAYSVSNPSHFHVIHLYSLDRGSDYRVTDGLSEDIEPQFDPDGRYLYWISIGRQISIESDTYLEQGRTVDPAKIMALTLDKDAPAPFSDARELLTGREAGRQTQGRIDVEGLGSRITALPVEASNYSDLLALKGRLVYRSEPAKGEAALKMLDLADGKETSLPRNARFFAPAARADAIAYRAGDKIGVWNIAPDGKIKETPVDLSALTMTIDWRQEWRQIFDAAWRSARDLFFDERMNGVDWPAMKRKYERFLPAVASRADLNDLIGRMLGELRYAETGISGGDLPAIPPSRRGLLGVDLEMDRASRLYRIAKIFRGQNWDPERTSPLTLPGMNVKPGDYLLAIDGTPLREGVNPDALLLDKAGASVTLTIGAGPGRTGAREIKVKPAAFSSREGDFLRYNDWVLGNLDKVNKAGDGKIGYIHIPDTYLPGIESFYRYFMTQFDKQALIVDIRFNSGGYSPYWMLEFLNRRFMFNQILPYGKLPMAEPLPGHFGPKSCIVNEWASSGGDMFAYTFKALQSGPLIGRRS